MPLDEQFHAHAAAFGVAWKSAGRLALAQFPGKHFLRSLIVSRTLLMQLVRRDFRQRFIGSAAGWLWGLNPSPGAAGELDIRVSDLFENTSCPQAR